MLVIPTLSLCFIVSLTLSFSLPYFIYKSLCHRASVLAGRPLTTHAIRSLEIIPMPLAARYSHLKHRCTTVHGDILSKTNGDYRDEWSFWISKLKQVGGKALRSYIWVSKCKIRVYSCSNLPSEIIIFKDTGVWILSSITVVQKTNQFMVWRKDGILTNV